MKADIHPKYHNCEVSCSCGNSFTTYSTLPVIKISTCNMCHPFYTGTNKLLDTQGRVDKFNKRYGLQAAKQN